MLVLLLTGNIAKLQQLNISGPEPGDKTFRVSICGKSSRV